MFIKHIADYSTYFKISSKTYEHNVLVKYNGFNKFSK